MFPEFPLESPNRTGGVAERMPQNSKSCILTFFSPKVPPFLRVRHFSTKHPPRQLQPPKCKLAPSKFGVVQTVFLVNRAFVPCQKGAALTKTAKTTNLPCLPTGSKGFAPQTPENGENDENGRCHSGKGMV